LHEIRENIDTVKRDLEEEAEKSGDLKDSKYNEQIQGEIFGIKSVVAVG
jgi:hypothetical protein